MDKTGLMVGVKVKEIATKGYVYQGCTVLSSDPVSIMFEVQRTISDEGGNVETVISQILVPWVNINHVIVMEDIARGERVRAYEVEGLVPGNMWQKLCDGVSVGHKRIQKFDRTEVAKVRLKVTESVAPPKIRRLAVFDVG